MVNIININKIKKSDTGIGYDISFSDGRSIYIMKRRTIIALLILIKYGDGCEADLAQGSKRIPEIKEIMKGKVPDNLIQDYYGDANKPFSELWNEEGFYFITNPIGQRRGRSQKYILKEEDHEKLFKISACKKASRRQPSRDEKRKICALQGSKCNICGSSIKSRKNIPDKAFCKDRRRVVFDHRVPVEMGGNSESDNYQALCFYCNKSKWQICNICETPDCEKCVLAHPEENHIIVPTNEDISDMLNRTSLCQNTLS